MAAIAKLFDNIQQNYLPIYLHNPSKRFITAQNEQDAINAAAIEYAVEIGGIRVKDDSNVSVANQRDYVIASQHKKIVKAQYVQHLGQSNEVINPLDILDTKGEEFVSAMSRPYGAGGDPGGPFLSGTSQPVPKFIQWWPEIYTVRLLDTPSAAGDVIRLYCASLPSAMSTGVTYDGSEEDLIAIAILTACNLRFGKTRDTTEAQALYGKYEKLVQSKMSFERKKRRPRQLEDGRYEMTRLRSINGSR